MIEQKYKFIDKSGHCFEDFQDKDDGSGYEDRIGAMFRAGCTFGVGDMLVFRDDLQYRGFVWGKDFYVIKVNEDESNSITNS